MKLFPIFPARWVSVLLLVLSATLARAQVYYFQQTGFTGGGIITGSFTVEGLSSGDQLVAFLPSNASLPFGHLQTFTLTFSGDSFVPSFTTHTLYGLVYNLDTPYLGDETNGAVEGVEFNWFYGSTGIGYASGRGPYDGIGGSVNDFDTGGVSTTSEAIAVSRSPFSETPTTGAVPEPSTYGILAAVSLLGLIASRRFRR